MISRCVGSSSTSRMRHTGDSEAEAAGTFIRPGIVTKGPWAAKQGLAATRGESHSASGSIARRARSKALDYVLLLTDLDGAVQRLDSHAPAAIAHLERQLVARPV